ncbi:MAG: hypothetical protein AB1714_01855 [Acidobacteriota bacterium]
MARRRETVRVRAFLREFSLWSLVAVGLALFHRALFFGETFYFRDLWKPFLPQKRLFAEMLANGILPLWDPYLHGGQPLLANPNFSLLYPSQILYLLLDPSLALSLEVAGHIILAGVAMYLLARALGLSSSSAFLAGAVFGYCGCTLSLGNLLNRLLAMPYMPLTIMYSHLYAVERRRSRALCAIACGMIQALAGSPETSALTLALLLAWLLFAAREGARPLRVIGGWLAFCAAVLASAAVLIVPAIEMYLQSVRAGTGTFESFAERSLHPWRLLDLILPGFLGPVDIIRDFWGAAQLDRGSPYLLSIYFGALALSLAIFGGVEPSDSGHGHLAPGIRRMLLAFMLGSILLSLGRFLPGARLLYEWAPPIRIFRFPEKLLIGAAFPCALLAAWAVDRILASPPRAGVWLARGLWVLTVAAVAGAALMAWCEPGSIAVQQMLFDRVAPHISRGLQLSLAHCAVVSVGGALLVSSSGRGRRAGLAGLLLLDLLVAGRGLNPTASRELLSAQPDAARLARRLAGPGRLYRDTDPPDVYIYFPTSSTLYQSLWMNAVLDEFRASAYHIPVVFHYDFDGMAPCRTVFLGGLVETLPWRERLPFLSSAGVSLVLTADPAPLPELVRLGRVENRSNTEFYFCSNNAGIAPACLVGSYSSAIDDRDAIEQMLAGFDPRKRVVLSNAPAVDHASASNQASGEIRLVADRPGGQIFDVRSESGGFLVIPQNYYPGWRTSVDGVTTAELRANYAFVAVRLGAGRHLVERRYQPWTVPVGAGISALALLLLILWTMWGRHDEHTRRPVAPS